MEKLTFDCEIITPMFLGNAEPKGRNGCELRPSAIKGALRFWWRAMNGDKSLVDQRNEDRSIRVKGLRTLEAEIFGTAGKEGDEDGGKSKVVVEVESSSLSATHFDLNSMNYQDNKTRLNGNPVARNIDLMKYFTYGMNENNQKRQYFKSGQKFKVHLNMTALNISTKNSIINAFYLTSFIGGLGSKSRNGFGKFHVNSRSDNNQHPDWRQLLRSLKTGTHSPYTSFSNDLTVWQTTVQPGEQRTWQSEFKKIAIAYKNAKSTVERERSYNYRKYVGLPLKGCNFYDRHSKTHFLTLMREPDGIRGYILHLPYLFMQDNNVGIAPDQSDYISKVRSSADSFNSKITLDNITAAL